jgi:hypothetical protein
VKTLAFVMSLVIIAVGAVGILTPPALVWIAQHSLAPVKLYLGGLGFPSAQDAPCCRLHPTCRRDCDALCGNRARSDSH